MNNNIFRKGLSLIEVLVVITIFSVLGVLVTQSVVLTLVGSRKSESIIHARENLDYALNIIERQIRNASYVYSDASYTAPCPNSGDTSSIYYKDQNGKESSFSCVYMGSDSYVASGSARLTSGSVRVTDCSFTCTAGATGAPDFVTIELSLAEDSASGAQGANVSASTQIRLRTY